MTTQVIIVAKGPMAVIVSKTNSSGRDVILPGTHREYCVYKEQALAIVEETYVQKVVREEFEQAPKVST